MVIRLEGNQREGKTLGMVSLGLLFADLLNKKYKERTLIASNIHVFKYKPFKFFQDWNEIGTLKDGFKIHNSVILFDEVGTAFDSRNYKDKQQILFTHLFSQMGKNGNTFIYTSQRDHMVEKRVKDQTDLVIECYLDWNTGTLYQKWKDTQRSIIYPKELGIRKADKEMIKLLYGFYNTREHVKSNISFNAI